MVLWPNVYGMFNSALQPLEPTDIDDFTAHDDCAVSKNEIEASELYIARQLWRRAARGVWDGLDGWGLRHYNHWLFPAGCRNAFLLCFYTYHWEVSCVLERMCSTVSNAGPLLDKGSAHDTTMQNFEDMMCSHCY